MLLLPKSLQQFQIPKVVVLLVLILLVVIGAVPAYLRGQFPGTHTPSLAPLKQLRTLRTAGITIPGWPTTPPQTLEIGGHRWITQQVTVPPDRRSALGSDSQLLLLLLPQKNSKTQPQVEWLDINGFLSASQFHLAKRSADSSPSNSRQPLSHAWKTDDFRLMQVPLPQNSTPPMTVRFFRGRTPNQTYALVQWYAWTGGGHPDTRRWFWADQVAQLGGNRLPWVAVCILIPIEPLGDITKVWAIAESLSQTLQSVLMAGPLQQ